MSRFFVHRPVFAAVIALLILLAGAISLPLLPIEQYPEITPPTVKVRASYPGASAKTLVESVTAPLEQAINGVDNMLYIRSLSSDSGTVEITVTFALGTDPDLAAVQVQNRVAGVESRLPEEVRRSGITTTKESTSIILYLSLMSPEGRYDQQFLSNYASLYIKDELARVSGVGNVTIFGSGDFSMRAWLDPEQLAARSLTADEVLGALRDQNVQVAAGQLGAAPAKTDSGFQYTLTTQGRLETVEEFGDIVLKIGDDQRVLRLKDVARIELGSETYSTFARINGVPTAALGVFQSPGSNMVATSTAVRDRVAELAEVFPDGLSYDVTFDFTDFVTASIDEVVSTLLVAVVLVVLVTFLFLQNVRATIVPTLAIPVSLVGTFAVLLASGFSLNLLSLFGLVLAIGIVVDDAIVVVENCTRILNEDRCTSREAAVKAMEQITGPVIATTLVVLAVFIPAAMLPGMTGRLYQQFAITIAVATLISSINALTLSPALCGILLRPDPERRAAPYRLFNAVLGFASAGYRGILKRALRVIVLALLVYAGAATATGWLLVKTPTGFLPQEDMGYFFANIELPDGAKLDRTDAVLRDTERAIGDLPGVKNVLTIGGYSLLSSTNEPNAGTIIAILEPWADRTSTEKQLRSIVGGAFAIISREPRAAGFPFTPPPIMGLGTSGGFEYQLQDRLAQGPQALEEAANDLVAAATEDARFGRTFSSFSARVPSLRVDVDRTKALRTGVSLGSVFNALQIGLGGAYVNDFNIFGRVYRVFVQNDAQYREDHDDIRRLQVRNKTGGMVPLDSLITIHEQFGPSSIYRYNLYASAPISGEGAPGVASGESIAAMEELSAAILPPGMSYEWTGATFQEIQAGNVAPLAFMLGLLVVYLVLAAQYESWLIPAAILLAVPFGVLGALLGLNAFGLANDVYAQIGLVLLIALVAKNAILIVEFAKERNEDGLTPREAAMDAARLRFRPVLMTAFSFIFGVLPLVLATGAGAHARVVLGMTVLSGTVLATVVGLLFTPIFFVVLQGLRQMGRSKAED